MDQQMKTAILAANLNDAQKLEFVKFVMEAKPLPMPSGTYDKEQQCIKCTIQSLEIEIKFSTNQKIRTFDVDARHVDNTHAFFARFKNSDIYEIRQYFQQGPTNTTYRAEYMFKDNKLTRVDFIDDTGSRIVIESEMTLFRISNTLRYNGPVFNKFIEFHQTGAYPKTLLDVTTPEAHQRLDLIHQYNRFVI
jgi:hypothetical protein